jgi:glycosyltransferase involved in cell wall biosynthesis
MRVVFYEPQHTGHHFAYLARMLPGFIDLPIDIVVATTDEALESVEYAKSLAPFGDAIELVPCCTPGPRAAVPDARHRLRELKETIRITKPDHLAVCFADGIWDQACVATLLGRRPWPPELVVEGWLYRGHFADPGDRRLRSIARRRLFRHLLRQGLFRKLHLDHELLYAFAEPLLAGSSVEAVLTPNPIVFLDPLAEDEARRSLGLPVDGKWLSLSGVIAGYKGVHLLVEAYRLYRAESHERPARLLLAGPHQPDVREKLASDPYRGLVRDGSIVSVDRYLNEGEMFAAAAAADLVLAPYPHHHGRSSIILWAAAAGRPSLGADDGCIGHVIRKERLGTTCDVRDTPALAAAIATALCQPWTDADVARVRRYAEGHRVENYQRVASEFVRARLKESP